MPDQSKCYIYSNSCIYIYTVFRRNLVTFLFPWLHDRFKDMADVVNAAKNSGNYTPEDEIMIHKKAHAIVNCYIDSSAPPKVQVYNDDDIA